MYSGFSLTRCTAIEIVSKTVDFSMNRGTPRLAFSKAIGGILKLR
jgi:hypothetical protein